MFRQSQVCKKVKIILISWPTVENNIKIVSVFNKIEFIDLRQVLGANSLCWLGCQDQRSVGILWFSGNTAWSIEKR
jgi:hypothetical protein